MEGHNIIIFVRKIFRKLSTNLPFYPFLLLDYTEFHVYRVRAVLWVRRSSGDRD